MAERVHRSAEISNLDTPEDIAGHNGNAALKEKARQVGSALGRAVVTLREAREALKDVGSETREMAAEHVHQAKIRIAEMAEAVKSEARAWTEAATSNAEQLREIAREKVQDAGSQFRTGFSQTRLRANRFAREYPWHFVLAAGAAGLLLGAGLRIWRSNREY